ncbi:hypothetical protein D3C75_1241960 [compost metagenome]
MLRIAPDAMMTGRKKMPLKKVLPIILRFSNMAQNKEKIRISGTWVSVDTIVDFSKGRKFTSVVKAARKCSNPINVAINPSLLTLRS